jgi:hypothetical protein
VTSGLDGGRSFVLALGSTDRACLFAHVLPTLSEAPAPQSAPWREEPSRFVKLTPAILEKKWSKGRRGYYSLSARSPCPHTSSPPSHGPTSRSSRVKENGERDLR